MQKGAVGFVVKPPDSFNLKRDIRFKARQLPFHLLVLMLSLDKGLGRRLILSNRSSELNVKLLAMLLKLCMALLCGMKSTLEFMQRSALLLVFCLECLNLAVLLIDLMLDMFDGRYELLDLIITLDNLLSQNSQLTLTRY